MVYDTVEDDALHEALADFENREERRTYTIQHGRSNSIIYEDNLHYKYSLKRTGKKKLYLDCSSKRNKKCPVSARIVINSKEKTIIIFDEHNHKAPPFVDNTHSNSSVHDEKMGYMSKVKPCVLDCEIIKYQSEIVCNDGKTIAGVHADVWKKIANNLSVGLQEVVTPSSIRNRIVRNRGHIKNKLGIITQKVIEPNLPNTINNKKMGCKSKVKPCVLDCEIIKYQSEIVCNDGKTIAGVHADVWKKIANNLSVGLQEVVTPSSIRNRVVRNSGHIKNKLGIITQKVIEPNLPNTINNIALTVTPEEYCTTSEYQPANHSCMNFPEVDDIVTVAGSNNDIFDVFENDHLNSPKVGITETTTETNKDNVNISQDTGFNHQNVDYIATEEGLNEGNHDVSKNNHLNSPNVVIIENTTETKKDNSLTEVAQINPHEVDERYYGTSTVEGSIYNDEDDPLRHWEVLNIDPLPF